MKMYKNAFRVLWVLLVTNSYILSGQINTLQAIKQDSSGIESALEGTGASIHAPSKRHFRTGFKEKYRDKSFDYTEKVKKNEESKPDFFTKLLMNLLGGNVLEAIVVIIKFLLYGLGIWLVYILLSIAMGKKGNWLFSNKNDSLVRFGTSEEMIESSDFKTLISKAKENQDFRSAIRYHYLYLLQILNSNGKIEYHTDKTNADYLYEIRDKSLASSFEYVSYIYDHAWYGGFNLDAEDYHMAEKAFLTTSKLMGHG